jgi:hypothetical protein
MGAAREASERRQKESVAEGPSFSYPLDDVLKVNHIQMKATHNSFHVEPPDNVYDGWRYTHAPLDLQLEEQGVRGFELDLHYNFALGYFRVFHTPPDPKSTCDRLVDCLSTLQRWSDEHPAHHPLFVQIEPKDSYGALDPAEYFKTLEAEILSTWPAERIITPGLVMGDAPDLATAVATAGWPTLGRVRGRILFVLIWTAEAASFYWNGGAAVKDNLLFVYGGFGQPHAAISIGDNPAGGNQAVEDALKAGFLIRTLTDLDNVEPLAGDVARRDAAIASGATVVSTDYPVAVDGVNYYVEIPGGAPSRCNPITAPPECTSEAIEDPAFMTGR